MLPVDPDCFERNLAGAINPLMADPAAREAMGRAGRRRAVEQFSWSAIAEATVRAFPDPRLAPARGLQRPPAAGAVVGDDLPEHRQQGRAVDRLALADGDRARRLVVVAAR